MIILLMFCLFILFCKIITNKPMNAYTYYELKGLSEKKLYEVFIENGLEVDDELEEYLTEEEIAKILKTDFDLLIQGISNRSHSMYFRFAKEVKRVYELLLEKHR
ncbi:hypothetical protein [Tissierella praeacuta]|nr:hypothetical protein [Tissierella praeacuta]